MVSQGRQDQVRETVDDSCKTYVITKLDRGIIGTTSANRNCRSRRSATCHAVRVENVDIRISVGFPDAPQF
jgi:hypothetical protein